MYKSEQMQFETCNRQPMSCQVDTVIANGYYDFMLTELPSGNGAGYNPGMSISNNVEKIAMELVARNETTPDKCRFIDRYTERSYDDSGNNDTDIRLSFVSFNWIYADGKYVASKPKFRAPQNDYVPAIQRYQKWLNVMLIDELDAVFELEEILTVQLLRIDGESSQTDQKKIQLRQHANEYATRLQDFVLNLTSQVDPPYLNMKLSIISCFDNSGNPVKQNLVNKIAD